MKERHEDLQQRLAFIDRTISHAACACREHDARVPFELKHCVDLMGHHTTQAQRALRERDVHTVRRSIDHLTRLSDRAQNVLHPADGMAYELKSAVILTHIELSALKHQLA